jgi:hypothetical protein
MLPQNLLGSPPAARGWQAVVLVALNLWWSATQSSVWLVAVPLLLGSAIVSAWQRIPRAVRRGRRLRAAASGATIVNPSAQRKHGRHQL